MAGMLAGMLRVLSVLAAFTAICAYGDTGILQLDEYTFHKVVDGSHDVFVRFEKEYPWGDDHDEFKELGKQIGQGNNKVLVVGFPLSASDDKAASLKIAEAYGAQEEKDWPQFRLFKKGVSSKQEPLKYSGPKKTKEMLRWVAAETGAYFGLKGQILAFEQLIDRYVSSDNTKQVLEEARTLPVELTEEEKEYADYYVKTFQRVADKGGAYVEAEQKRLSKLLDDKNITEQKKSLFQYRLNILASFATKLKAAAAAEARSEL